MISQTMEEGEEEGVTGSIRPNENMVSVWVRSEVDADTPFLARMTDALRGQLGLKPRAKVFHQYHRDGEGASSGGRADWQGKSRSLPQTPDHSSDDEGGALNGVGVQPDILTEKLMQLATERSGREVKETMTIEQSSSWRLRARRRVRPGSGGQLEDTIPLASPSPPAEA